VNTDPADCRVYLLSVEIAIKLIDERERERERERGESVAIKLN
jgi:hypothetical protein